jgi:hypothetical protein
MKYTILASMAALLVAAEAGTEVPALTTAPTLTPPAASSDDLNQYQDK